MITSFIKPFRDPATPARFWGPNELAPQRFTDFFTVHIRNPHTRRAYLRVWTHFTHWAHRRGLTFADLRPVTIAAYVEELGQTRSKPTVKQHLAAIRMLLDWMVTGQILPMNPAAAVRGPRYQVRKGKTPVLSVAEMRDLLNAIAGHRPIDLRDRALVSVMVYTFGRVGAVLGMKAEDYFVEQRHHWFRLHEKGGKRHEVPAHPEARRAVEEWLAAAPAAPGVFVFRTFDRQGRVTRSPLGPSDALRLIKRRARQAGLSPAICCHSLRATGITNYLAHGGTLEKAQAIAAHESPRTTKLYDRTSDTLTVEEIERIRF